MRALPLVTGMESIFKLDLRSEKNSVPACGFISKLNQFQLESVWLSSSLSSTLFFLFFLLLLILCTDLSATLSTEDTRLLFVVHNSHTYPIALAQTLTAPWREGGGSGVFPQKLPQLPRMPWGSTRDSGKGVSRKPSYHVQWGAAFQEQPPSCTMPPPRPQVPGNVSHSSNMGRFKNLPQRNRHSLFQWAICKKED